MIIDHHRKSSMFLLSILRNFAHQTSLRKSAQKCGSQNSDTCAKERWRIISSLALDSISIAANIVNIAKDRSTPSLPQSSANIAKYRKVVQNRCFAHRSINIDVYRSPHARQVKLNKDATRARALTQRPSAPRPLSSHLLQPPCPTIRIFSSLPTSFTPHMRTLEIHLNMSSCLLSLSAPLPPHPPLTYLCASGGCVCACVCTMFQATRVSPVRVVVVGCK